jgi:hypothetical protein
MMARRKPKPRQPQSQSRADLLLAQGLVRDKESGLLLSAHDNDTGPVERRQHGMGIAVRRHIVSNGRSGWSERTGALAVDECLFEALVERGIVSTPLPPTPTAAQQDLAEQALDRRIAAAHWLRKLWTSAGIAQRVSASYSVASTRTDNEMSDDDAEDQRRFRAVWAAIGQQRADLLASIVCHQQAPVGATPVALREALDALAEWRGL